MMKIGVGILCFGDEFYFNGTVNKLTNLLNHNVDCYVITDKPHYFSGLNVDVIPYKREIQSYSDKLLLPKYVLEKNDVCIIVDADADIKDFSIFEKLKTYNFKPGITYIDTLLSHPTKKKLIGDINMKENEWREYQTYCKSILPTFNTHETIWEYFLVINKTDFNYKKFYYEYEKLQLIKEYCDLPYGKNVVGAGEGISILISSILSNTPIQRDEELYEMLKNNVISISKRHTKPQFWPSWMI